MLLADLGNTRGKFYQLIEEQLTLLGYWDYQSEPESVLAPYTGETLFFASVTQLKYEERLCQTVQNLQIQCKPVKTRPYGCGVINGYQHYEQLGVDRWLALIGARELTLAPCIVIDAGTAVTVDVMDEFGQHKGGWIFPGVELMTQSLLTSTAALKGASATQSLQLAHNTKQGIANGILASVVGAVQLSIESAHAVLKTQHPPQLILTGGNAELLTPYLSLSCQIEPELVLKGLVRSAGCLI